VCDLYPFCDRLTTLFDGLGPYDAIHVGAAAATVPSALIEQLASPGRMFIPVGTLMQYIEQVDKDVAGNVSTQKVMGVRVRSTQKKSFILTPNY
jgi:protein-L-isoaspartate O-methyltransferase